MGSHRFEIWWEPTSWIITRYFLAVSSNGRRAHKNSWDLFNKGTNPIHGGTTLMHYTPPKVSPLITINFAVMFQHMNFGGTQTVSLQKRLSLTFWKVQYVIFKNLRLSSKVIIFHSLPQPDIYMSLQSNLFHWWHFLCSFKHTYDVILHCQIELVLFTKKKNQRSMKTSETNFLRDILLEEIFKKWILTSTLLQNTQGTSVWKNQFWY